MSSIQRFIEMENCYAAILQKVINSGNTSCQSFWSLSMMNRADLCLVFVVDALYLPLCCLCVSHVTLCNYVLLDWEQAPNTPSSSHKAGCVFFNTFCFATTKLYETHTILYRRNELQNMQKGLMSPL